MVGEANVQLIEQTVQNNVEDLRELKQKVSHMDRDLSDLKSDQQLTKQSVAHVMETLSELKGGIKELDAKFDKNTIDQLQAYKSAVWKVAITVTGGLIVAVILFIWGVG